MRVLGWTAIGALVGVLLIGTIRFAADPGGRHVHFHANWALYIDGTRLDLSGERYMEDVEACVHGEHVQPRGRVHMHNGEDQVVHVHHEGVSWGHLLQNLGFAAGRDFLVLDDGRTLSSAGGRSLKYVLNGFAAADVRDRLIAPGDRLLISYGEESSAEVLAGQFPLVPDDAPRYDELPDPASCAGAVQDGVGTRLRRAFLW